MVFCFAQKKIFGQHKSQNIIFFVAQRAKFFPEFNIRLYDKNSESDYFFFPPPKSEYFFQQHWESEYLNKKKNKHNPPFKLNGRSLMRQSIIKLLARNPQNVSMQSSSNNKTLNSWLLARVITSCNNVQTVAPVTNLFLGGATKRSHSSQWSKK